MYQYINEKKKTALLIGNHTFSSNLGMTVHAAVENHIRLRLLQFTTLLVQ